MIKVNSGLESSGPAGGPWPVLGPTEFDDPTERIYAGILGPGQAIAAHRHAGGTEEAHVILDEARVLGPAEEIAVSRPSVAVAFAGCTHGLINSGLGFLRYLRIVMAPEGSETSLPADDQAGTPSVMALDADQLDEFAAHGGLGRILFRRLWNHDAFSSNWGFVDHAVVPPGTSIGYHRHDAVQECYLILQGEGVMKVDRDVERVSTGDCIPNRLGGSHGLANPGPGPVELINVALFQRKGEFDATDLGDDLSDLM